MKKTIHILYLLPILCFMLYLCRSCSLPGKQGKRPAALLLSIPEQEEEDMEEEIIIDSVESNLPNDPLLMNAIRENETGQLYATDLISASEVVAKFRNVPERNGQVSIAFQIKVPEEMTDSRWQLKFYPELEMGKRHLLLEPVYITGKKYREQQLRGYQKYQRFIDSIILDSAYFVRKELLEIFLERNFPQIYKLKSDSSFVDDDAGYWGVRKEEVVAHYTRTMLKRHHRERWDRRNERFRKYVKDPFPEGGIRLDSVINDSGMLQYNYTQSLKVERKIRKLLLYVNGGLYANGKQIDTIPATDTLEFYITSLSALTEKVERKKMKVISRKVCDSTKAFINFCSGGYRVDTSYMDNAAEFGRIGRCIDGVVSLEKMVLDSLVITATCSPEGRYDFNARLSEKRSRAISEYVETFLPDSLKDRVVSSSVPENWSGLCRMVEGDSLMSPESRHRVLAASLKYDEDPDRTDHSLSLMPEYPYLRQKVYPSLRTVSFEFHLHRPDMQKDTVHTSETDTVYMDGLEAMTNMEYKTAVSKLRSYKDYNAALACVLADYNHSAWEILESLKEENARILYLKAIVCSRLGYLHEAGQYLERSIGLDASMKFRAGLDPELSLLTKKNK